MISYIWGLETVLLCIYIYKYVYIYMHNNSYKNISYAIVSYTSILTSSYLISLNEINNLKLSLKYCTTS